MSRTCRRNAFTLIEVLIVVIIMAILAATIIPQFTSSTEDATASTMQFNVHTMRSQIEVYKMHHLGKLPDDDKFEAKMTKQTNIDGDVNPGASDPVTYPYGPYIQEIPPNPHNGSNVVKEQAVAAGDDSSGWQFDTTTGLIYPNHTGYTP